MKECLHMSADIIPYPSRSKNTLPRIHRIIRKSETRRANAIRRFDALHTMPDEDLMELFQDGTVEAYNILMDRYSERLVHYLYGFLGDKKRCEDILQETFLRVHRNRHSYQRIAKFSTWLYTIAGNLARSEYRKQKRRHMYSIQSMNRDSEEYEMPLPDETFLPDRHTESALQDKQIQEALTILQPSFREVIILRDVQQLAYDEIAEITGLPMGTVKSRINRGRSKLREMLRDVYPFDKDEEGLLLDSSPDSGTSLKPVR